VADRRISVHELLFNVKLEPRVRQPVGQQDILKILYWEGG
jgi:hypothetical protein